MSLFFNTISRLWNVASDEVLKNRRLTLQDGRGWSSLYGLRTTSGKSVTLDSALQLSTFWACVRVTAGAVASLPLAVYRKDGDDRKQIDNDFADVLTNSPNQDQTPLEYWESMVAWLLVRGNAYSFQEKVGARLVSLDPLPASHCRPKRLDDGTLVYEYLDRGKLETIARDKIFHIKGFGQGLNNRDEGLSAIAYGANSLGAAMAADSAAASTFANGMQPSGILSSDQGLDKKQREELQKVMEQYVGSDKAGKLMVLEGGLKYAPASMNPEDAQLLDTRKFSVEEVCRWTGTPPIIIGHASQGQTMWGSGVEQLLVAWLALGIDPICDRIEARVYKQLIRPAMSRKIYAEFNREALLQMDSKAKAEYLSKVTQNGLMTRDEGRAKLNLPKMPGGDILTVQSALVPLDKLGEKPAPAPAPNPPANPEEDESETEDGNENETQ